MLRIVYHHVLLIGFLAVMMRPLQASAQEAAGVAYLKTGSTARELAMGESGVSLVQGASSAYWNPAGLAMHGSQEVMATYQRWVGSVRFYAALGHMTRGLQDGWGGFVQAVTEEGEEGKSRVALATAGLGYGRRFGRVSAGIMVKGLAEHVLTETLYGYAIDVGMQVVWYGVQWGMVLQNMGSVQELEAFTAPLPRTFRTGVSFYPLRMVTLLDNQPVLELVVTVDYVHRPDAHEPFWGKGVGSWHLGGALKALDLVEWRIGYITRDTVREFSLGFGVWFNRVYVDYAYIPFKPGFEGTAGHVFSLSTRWL